MPGNSPAGNLRFFIFWPTRVSGHCVCVFLVTLSLVCMSCLACSLVLSQSMSPFLPPFLPLFLPPFLLPSLAPLPPFSLSLSFHICACFSRSLMHAISLFFSFSRAPIPTSLAPAPPPSNPLFAHVVRVHMCECVLNVHQTFE